MNFEKWQALGNDYVILEQDELPFELTPGRIKKLCAPHSGIGADGILLLSRTAGESVASMRIFNPDGSEAELSGNGAREAILYLRRHGWTEADEFQIDTRAGRLQPTITSPTTCRVELGFARTASDDFPSGPPDGQGELEAAGQRWRFRHVQVGNPQCAIPVADPRGLSSLQLDMVGPAIEHSPLFPNRTNVSWYASLRQDRIRARIFERGVGETAASGTGATGAAVAHVLDGGRSPVTVELDGGELEVEVDEDLRITLSGWAVPVFFGRLSQELIEELDEAE